MPWSYATTSAVIVTSSPAGASGSSEMSVVVVGARTTETLAGYDVLGSCVASPLYSAVSWWLPIARLAVVKMGSPNSSGATAPSGLPLSLKVTLPLRNGKNDETSAVRVTGTPVSTVSAEAVRVVVLAKPYIVTPKPPDVLA